MRLRFRLNSLTGKLSTLIIAAMLFTFAVMGIYFDRFLKQSYLQSAKKQMLHAFERVAQHQNEVTKTLVQGVGFLRQDEGMLASIDLINNYQDKHHYNVYLLDEEKKSIASRLLDQVKLSFNDDIALYDRNEELSVYVTRETQGYLLHFISYEDGLPVLFERYEHENSFRRLPFTERPLIPYKHKAYYDTASQIAGTPLTRHIRNGTLVVKSHLSLFESTAPARIIAHGEMTRIFDAAYFERLSNELGITLKLSQQPDAHARALGETLPLNLFAIDESSDAYIGTRRIDTEDGPLYIVAMLDKSALQAALERNRQQFFILLFTVAAVILFVLRQLFHQGVADPLNRLMAQIARIETQDYTPLQALHTGDELETISKNINRLAGAVEERERSLQQSQRELERLSTHDPLTDLPNRRLFSQRLEHALKRSRRNRSRVALLFLDIDLFKQVNDTLGHHIGDELLRQVALRLRSNLRESDTLARIGGDEFNVLIEEVGTLHALEGVVFKLLEEFRRPYDCLGHEISSTVSIGVALSPDDGDDSITLIKHADLAMYQAKDSGRNSYHFFSRDLSEKLQERLDTTQALKAAIASQQELFLLYQPKIALNRHALSGIEALVRWQSPLYGLVNPADFIPLAEETGLIIPLGAWVLQQACSDFVALNRQGFDLDHISINVSSVQLRRSDMIATLRAVIAATGIRPGQIELEITESYIATGAADALGTLQRFRDMGIRLAVDDFGTGYSSMSYLKQLPITRLKIDKSFVDGLPGDPEDVAIASAIIALAKSFRLSITAEGVETPEQLAFLDAHKCDEAQGFLYAKPLDLDGLKRFRQTLEPL